jgi:tetratricopeptide (TPR) repeat protein
MMSQIPGFEYDIFISYRQKDNKYDGWVSEFVDNLRKELEATFKEDVTVYFDNNPHDGLLETHDVDASLKDKLKCLIFIPVISRTYCDPKSFAWENEFEEFLKQASKDQFGLKVKLPNGNVASRVLPVRIHDLSQEDINMVEKAIGVIRPIDFIYHTPGVNRPLRQRDDDTIQPTKQLVYRDQINKLANAIDEIIGGLNIVPNEPEKGTSQYNESSKVISEERIIPIIGKSGKRTINKLLSAGILVTLLLVAGGIIIHSKIFKHDILTQLRSSDGRISVLVLPFQNMTNDTIWNVWQDGIQNELITYLTNFKDLHVRQIESVTGLLRGKGLTDYASLTPSVSYDISRKLDANVLINGTIKQAGSTIRINAHMIESETEEVLKSFQVDGSPAQILLLIDSLSAMTKNFLILSKLEKEIQSDFREFVSTSSPEAYRYFILGYNAYYKYDNPSAIKFFSQAIKLDSNFLAAQVWLSGSYVNQGLDAPDKQIYYESAKKWALKAYERKEQLPLQQRIYAEIMYSYCFETPLETIKCFRQLQEIDEQSPNIHFEIGFNYTVILKQYDNAIPEFEKSLAIYKKWGTKPPWIFDYELAGIAYYKTGQYKKAEDILKQAEVDFPETESNLFYWELIYWQAIVSLSQGDTVAANQSIKKYVTIRKLKSDPDALITLGLAWLFNQAGIPDRAENYFRQAISMHPNDPYLLNELAYFLIDNDRNIEEGLKLADQSLKVHPDNYLYLDTKGWGLYKQGKKKEALELLEKSWNLKPIYDHRVYLHLEEAKKAVAGQKL